MTQQDQEILLLAQRILFLSQGNQKVCRDEEELFFRLSKIRELAKVLVPRIEDKLECAP